MSFLKRIRISLGGERGFSLAEVLVAGLILAVAVIPMVGMFDGAYKVSMMSYNINLADECLRLYTERVRNIPFYNAHEADAPDAVVDVDDHYWGSRSPDINDNSWSTAPQVEMKALGVEPYPDMSVSIKMSYVDDAEVDGVSLAEAADATSLADGWGPKGLAYIYGYDRPKTPGGKTLNLILYEVTVTTREGQTFSNTELYASPTDVVANIYIDKVVNVSADTTKLGTYDNEFGDCISAPHNKDSITIRAYGEGFTQEDYDGGTVDIKLVRVDDNDITLSNVTVGADGDYRYLEGTIDLSSGGVTSTAENVNVWDPRRKPGNWHAWLVVNHVISIRNNAFVVEYPVPVYREPGSDFDDSDTDKSGEASTTDEVITLHNVDFVTDFENVEPYNPEINPGIGAVVQLVHTELEPIDPLSPDEVREPIDIINGINMTISPDVQQGYAQGLTVTAEFDFTGHIGGDYYLRVINCIERSTADIDTPGNTYFELPDGPYYYLEGPPGLYGVTVKGYVDPVEVYVESTTPQTRSFGFDERDYMYWLRVDGVNFDSLVTLKMGLGDKVTPTNLIDAVSITYIDQYSLEAVFDFAPDVEPGEEGHYWVYAENSNGFGEFLFSDTEPEAGFYILEPKPIIYDYTWMTDPQGRQSGPWQNYYWQGMVIEGECFDYDELAGESIEIKILNGGNDWPATEAMDDPVVTEMGRLVGCHINLVDCDVGTWNLYGLSQPAGETHNAYDDEIQDETYLSMIDVDVGAPILLTDDVPIAGEEASISITSHYQDWYNAGTPETPVWKWSNWFAWQPSTEGNGQPAWANENDPDWPVESQDYRTKGEMYFATIRGMGFNKDNTLMVEARNDDYPNRGPGMQALWIGLVVQMDRSTPEVWIEMVEADVQTTGPDEGGMGRLRLGNNALGTWEDWYVDRFDLRAR